MERLKRAQKKLITNQHCGAKIEFMKKLCDENMNLEHLCDIFSFNITKNINEPFEMTM